ncbi:lytic transglycosylase domain-containing protein [Paraherbaspirillum soli]|uniref:Lytic transglycosylase domain-containing protein n=1 Tax=Paraherbaspirillum soli TaxID=631222 RepID=A0ABW0MAB7_9BURK
MKLPVRLSGLMLSLTMALGLASALAPTAAHADVYGYIDADGAGHFSTEKLDGRYQLFMRGGAEFDSAQLTPGAAGHQNTQRLDSPLFRYLSQHPNLKKYETIVDQAAQEFALEPALLKAVMAAESGFNPAAVSPKGAIGLMQIMPATAERYGLSSDRNKPLEQKLTDPRTNIRLGARYLRDLLKMFPRQQELVIASYNAGEGAVQKYNNQIPPYPETRNYVQLVRQFYQLYQPAFAKSARNSAGNDSGLSRIHMTIPGRRSMPATMPAAMPTATSPLIE